jgi:hypothetical protein
MKMGKMMTKMALMTARKKMVMKKRKSKKV